MKQTEELFKYGKVTSGGGRGKMFANGTAYSEGTAFVEGKAFATIGGGTWKPGGIGGSSSSSSSSSNTVVNNYNYNYNVSSGSTSNDYSVSSSDTTEEAEEFKETMDWIEIAIDRIERALSSLDRIASSAFSSWAEKAAALNEQMVETRNEIDLQQRAYDRYIQEANSVGLSADWQDKVKNGKVDIEQITDEGLKEQIDNFQEWYEKALDAKDAIEELNDQLNELYSQKFENVTEEFDGYVSSIEFEKNAIEEIINRYENDGYMISAQFYKELQNNVHEQAEMLRKEKAELLAARDEAVNSGAMAVGSKEWYEMNQQIDDVTLSIYECQTAWSEYAKSIRETDWEFFDKFQDMISQVADESDFLVDLMSNKKLYDDRGQLTDEGMATMGLHGVNYNVYMAQSEKYAEEIEKINKDIANDPYNQDLLERRQELLEAQRESILAAEEEKNAIKDMVEEGIQLELDSLSELIDKYKEALETQKDLYDYQRKVEEQTKNIADLEKQLSAYAGDDSEESQSKIQEIKVELEEAKQDLQDTEYDQYISDQERLLDELYDQYELILNQRLDNIDALIADMIVEINSNAGTISETINMAADNVGYTLTDSMSTIWDVNSGKITSVVSMYGDKFSSNWTTTILALNNIGNYMLSMKQAMNQLAYEKIQQVENDSAANTPVTTPPAQEQTQQSTPQPAPTPQITIGGKINAGGATIYADSYGGGAGRQYFRNDPIYTVLDERNGYILVRHHSLSSGYTGWFRKSDVSAYKTGKKLIGDDEIAWTQEDGAEMIVRPSDGAILTPLAKNDSVLTSAASNNIWDMANNPSDFIKDNLGVDNVSSPTQNVGNSNYTQYFDKVEFVLPNVQNYDQLLRSMQKDRNFERLISSMTIDKVAGKNSTLKGKAIR